MAEIDYLISRMKQVDDENYQRLEEAVLERGLDIVQEKNDEVVHIRDLSDEIMAEYKDWGKLKGLRTGLPSLDQKLGGIGNGHVVLIGGETSNGKSALAANIMVNVAKEHPVLLITLEMTHNEMGARIAHMNGGTLEGLNIFFQKKHRISYKDIKKLVINALLLAPIKMVMLDYLQYLGRGMTEKEVAIMSKEIKTLAIEFDIPFMVIVSLRKGDSGKGKRKWTDIEIEDYMGAGAIGYDCDAAMIASRKNRDNDYDDEHIYIKILKTRNAKLDYSDRYIQLDWSETRITENWSQNGIVKPVHKTAGEFDNAKVASGGDEPELPQFFIK